MKHLLVVKSDTTIGQAVGSMSELGPDVWEHEQRVVQQLSRDGLAWYAGLAGAELRGPVRWRLHDITRSVYPYADAPVVEEGAWT